MAPLAAALVALGIALPLVGVPPPLVLAYAMLVAAPAAGFVLGRPAQRALARSRRPVQMSGLGILLSVGSCVSGALLLGVARDVAGFAVLAAGMAGLGVVAGLTARASGQALRKSTSVLPTRMS